MSNPGMYSLGSKFHTTDELAWLRQACQRAITEHPGISADEAEAQFLESYLEVASRRAVWLPMDKFEVLGWVKRRLAEVKQKGDVA